MFKLACIMSVKQKKGVWMRHEVTLCSYQWLYNRYTTLPCFFPLHLFLSSVTHSKIRRNANTAVTSWRTVQLCTILFPHIPCVELHSSFLLQHSCATIPTIWATSSTALHYITIHTKYNNSICNIPTLFRGMRKSSATRSSQFFVHKVWKL